MAGKPGSQMITLIARAAYARCAGRTWESIAEELNRGEIVKQWPIRYRAEWEAAYTKAHAEVMDVSRDNALAVLNDKLHSDREDIQVRAAEAICNLHVRERPPTQRVEAAMTFEAIMPHREEADGS